MSISKDDEANRRVNDLLERYDLYIRGLAHRLLPSNLGQLEVEDLIQRSRIKLWQAAMKRSITYPRSYIPRIVRSAYMDMCREYKAVFSLPLNDDGELMKGTILISLSEGMGDPQDVLEREEGLVERLDMLSYYITRLPRQQRYAMLLRLKKRVDNLSLLTSCLRKYRVSIEDVYCPIDKSNKQKLASSVAPALTKIDTFFKTRNARYKM